MPVQDDTSLPDLSTDGLELLGIGISGIVYALDKDTVVKTAPIYNNEYATNSSFEDLQTERAVYQQLGSHPRICQYISSVQRGIVLERFGEALRKRLRELHEQNKTPSPTQALKWSTQVAEGVAYLHQKGIVQGDVGCHNILLKGDEIKFCDFGGSSINGKPAEAGYECRSQRWDETGENPSIQSELFALGSTIYEIWTTMKPYQDEPEEVVEQNYKAQRFPEVRTLPVAEIILNCWHGTYQSAGEVVAALQSLQDDPTRMHKSKDSNVAANRRTVLAALACVITAFVLAAWLQLNQIHRPTYFERLMSGDNADKSGRTLDSCSFNTACRDEPYLNHFSPFSVAHRAFLARLLCGTHDHVWIRSSILAVPFQSSGGWIGTEGIGSVGHSVVCGTMGVDIDHVVIVTRFPNCNRRTPGLVMPVQLAWSVKSTRSHSVEVREPAAEARSMDR